ncbi:hypothetical protein GCM10023169_26840 [Georgenia halophila]|uniref:Glycine zipper family protein n=1 Tax=Georgenia halophila TaxID=620889 RepID=A0ABP8LE08_9MICO
MTDQPQEPEKPKQSGGNPIVGTWMAVGIAMGSGMGAGLGVALDNIGMGVALGIPMGMVVGIAIGTARSSRSEETGNDESGEPDDDARSG